ncbi:Protein CBG07484 [Caenorhabditis briggsae]|uniref:Protein CBG07484 n=1 Tax=Caenorhabditis briggsae TaxID=6238 RepID=A8X4P0_CAEBR|nr:Protein CBG07484 [Caenorhabditis briggsae]CAP27600.2 Protein CBG07484 [Caenorhabditis briggsae]
MNSQIARINKKNNVTETLLKTLVRKLERKNAHQGKIITFQTDPYLYDRFQKPRRTSTRRIMGPSHSLSKKPQPLIFITEGIYRSARNAFLVRQELKKCAIDGKPREVRVEWRLLQKSRMEIIDTI